MLDFTGARADHCMEASCTTSPPCVPVFKLFAAVRTASRLDSNSAIFSCASSSIVAASSRNVSASFRLASARVFLATSSGDFPECTTRDAFAAQLFQNGWLAGKVLLSSAERAPYRVAGEVVRELAPTPGTGTKAEGEEE